MSAQTATRVDRGFRAFETASPGHTARQTADCGTLTIESTDDGTSGGSGGTDDGTSGGSGGTDDGTSGGSGGTTVPSFENNQTLVYGAVGFLALLLVAIIAG